LVVGEQEEVVGEQSQLEDVGELEEDEEQG
jgi:hypothetical protein